MRLLAWLAVDLTLQGTCGTMRRDKMGMAEKFDINKLNAAQREAVRVIDGPVLILAGAGTGKTRTVTCRIAQMLKQGVKAKGILALTFTNKAANEMAQRVAGPVGRERPDRSHQTPYHGTRRTAGEVGAGAGVGSVLRSA